MYSHTNDKDRLKKFPSQEFRLKKREEMHQLMIETKTSFSALKHNFKLILESDLFNTTKYTYLGKPVYTIDYIIYNIKREGENLAREEKTAKEIAQMKYGHWFFGLFH